MTIKERLDLFIQEQGLSRSLFEKRSGLANGYLRQLRKAPSLDKIESIISAFPQLNKEWLLTGDGQMLIPDDPPPTPPPATDDDKDTVMVPLLNLDARGGFSDNLEVGRQYTDRLIAWNGAHSGDFAVEVSGTSMMPQIPPGSRILLRQIEDWREYLEKNLPYVIELRDERRLLKVIQRSDLGEQYLDLMSYNPDVPTEPLPVALIRRIYKVVGTLINYGF